MITQGKTPAKKTTCVKSKATFLSQRELKVYHKQLLASLNSLKCIYGGHVIRDVTSLLKMISKIIYNLARSNLFGETLESARFILEDRSP